MGDWPKVYSVCDKCGTINHADHSSELAQSEKSNTIRAVLAEFVREYESVFPAHATLSIGGTGHPIESRSDCGGCRLYSVYQKARDALKEVE